MSQHLKQLQIEHRYCKLIRSRATTLMIRIITSCFKSSGKLLNEGVFCRHRYYPNYPSNPPAPISQPCSRCQSFTHTRVNCNTPSINVWANFHQSVHYVALKNTQFGPLSALEDQLNPSKVYQMHRWNLSTRKLERWMLQLQKIPKDTPQSQFTTWLWTRIFTN